MKGATQIVRSFRAGWRLEKKTRWGRVRCAKRKVAEEDLLKFAKSLEEVREIMGDDPEANDEDYRDLYPTFPFEPKPPRPPPPRGTHNAKLHREAEARILQKRGGSRQKMPEVEELERTAVVKDLGPATPVPWNRAVDLSPKEPFVHFPPLREPFTEVRHYQWKRHDYIPGIGDLYPDNEVQVTVTLTNTPDAADAWAQARMDEGNRIYGMETKWWTWEKKGLYYSDSFPARWSDLALLQLATEYEVLLVQPLDMPVEKLGPKLRELLKYKFLKKASFRMEPKAKALKVCEVKAHGCHDFAQLLKLQLGMEHVQDLPVDFRAQDLSAMAQLLLGLDLKPRETCKAHWEKEYLEESWVELAAKEAWSCWALYGLITRMELGHVELWNACLPEVFHSDAYAKERVSRKQLLTGNGVILKDVSKAEHRRQTTQKTPAWRIAKESAVELAHDIGLDLTREVDSDTMQES